MQNIREVRVWKNAHELVLHVYQSTKAFPPEEKFDLTRQIHRAAVSISANIAEGRGRQSDPEFARFLWMAHGSANELDSHLLIARDLGFLDLLAQERLAGEIDVVRKMIYVLISSLNIPGRARSDGR